jgi:hypothetical protein
VRAPTSALAGALAAVVATAGDLLLLWVANSRRPGSLLAAAPPSILWLGGALGVIAIPFYAFGYRAMAQSFSPTEARAARVVLVTGVSLALLGAVLHGLTTLHLASEMRAEVPGRDPLLDVAGSAPLLVLWGIGGLLGAIASAVFARTVGRGRSRLPPRLGWVNPFALSLVLGAIGLPVAALRDYLTPAAPNVAHAISFFVCAMAVRRVARDDSGA